MIFPKTKKAMMDDLFDFFFTVFIALFAFLFIHVALVQSVDHRNEESVKLVQEVVADQKILVDQRFALEQGGDLSLDTLDKTTKISLTEKIEQRQDQLTEQALSQGFTIIKEK